MRTGQLIEYLDSRFVPSCQEDYDNAGFLLGDPERELNGVLLSVDVTPAVVEEAIEKGLNLIVSHHPLIFSGLKQITPSNEISRMVMRLLESGIGVYAAHTNLDNLKWGVNGILAEQLGLAECHILRPQDNTVSTIGAGMIGQLPSPTPADRFLSDVKRILKLPVIRLSGNFRPAALSDTIISKVAICGGSGSFLIDDAKRCQADIFLTGDLKYHDFQKAESTSNFLIADIGHFESEQFTKELFYRVISEKFSTFACLKSEKDSGYYIYI